MNDQAPNATFRSMEESTAEDWQKIGGQFMPFAAGLADRVLSHLKLLDGDYGGFPIDRLQHSLQTATRAHRPRPRVRGSMLNVGDGVTADSERVAR